MTSKTAAGVKLAFGAIIVPKAIGSGRLLEALANQLFELQVTGPACSASVKS